MTGMTDKYPFAFDEELDCAEHAAWFMDLVHIPSGLADYHAGPYVAECCTHGFCWAAEQISLPQSKGVIWKDYNALRYIITPIIVESEAEVKEREVKFKENLVREAEEFGPTWEKYKSELLEIYRPFKEYDLKKATNLELGHKYRQMLDIGYRMTEIHFWGMYVSFAFFTLFRELCRSLGVDTESKDFVGMIRGFDNASFKCEREMWKLSRRALEANLGAILRLPSEEVAPQLEKEERGREWLEALREFLVEYGWRCERCWFPSSPSWQEDPKYAIRKIQEYLKLEDTPSFLEGADEEREHTIARLRPSVPKEKLETFDLLLKGAQYADAYSEEHDLYCEMQTDALRRMYALELGRRFVDAGTIEEVDDIFWLRPQEIESKIYWPEKWRLQSVVEERKSEAQQEVEKGLPPVVSHKMGMDEAFGYMMGCGDPVLINVAIGEIPEPKPELKADLVGVGGAPGVAEGPARVVFTDDQVDEVLPGEILVCPTTTIGWTTVFSFIKGAVVDRGGVLSHAAVVSRQFGVPCVMNTFVGTEKIKTGQRLRIDGRTGGVWILDE